MSLPKRTQFGASKIGSKLRKLGLPSISSNWKVSSGSIGFGAAIHSTPSRTASKYMSWYALVSNNRERHALGVSIIKLFSGSNKSLGHHVYQPVVSHSGVLYFTLWSSALGLCTLTPKLVSVSATPCRSSFASSINHFGYAPSNGLTSSMS